ncbi:MAG: three component ABC system middle component [Thermoplasmatota archaeon]
MKSWNERPQEVAALLNPSFCGEIIRRATKAYLSESSEGMPYVEAFLVLPIVLHKRSRDLIKSTTKHLHVWLTDNPHVRIGYADRAKDLVPYTAEALMFMLQAKALDVDLDARLLPGELKGKSPASQKQGEVGECYKKAESVGIWFARAGSAKTVFTMMGVRP